MADKKNNALADLAARLEEIAEVERESAVFHGDPLDVSDDINKAQRIVAEIAKVELTSHKINYGMCRMFAYSIDHLVDACRAIAEEGEAKDE